MFLFLQWWQVDKVSPIKLFEENKTVSGLNLRHLLYQQKCDGLVKRVVDQVFQLYQEGKIKPTIDSTWALEDVTEAMQKLHDRKNIGKIVIDPSLEPKPKPATPAKGKSKDKKNAMQEDKKAASVESNEESEKKKEPELTNGTSGDKSDSGKYNPYSLFFFLDTRWPENNNNKNTLWIVTRYLPQVSSVVLWVLPLIILCTI